MKASSISLTATLSSASVANARLRSLATMAVATLPHVPSTLAFCLGLRTPVGMIAVM